MSLVSDVRRFLERHGIAAPVIVACSGGGDSTALLLAFVDLGIEVRAAHVNHHLRGAESDADEAFVRDLCDGLGVPLDVGDGTLDVEAVRHRGVEAAAREVRHRRLHEIAQCADIRWIATAHQKNDQAETVLMRIMTGTGLAGLRGIHPLRDDGFVRPLLGVARSEIDAFLAERRITPRVDSSNVDPRFLRNRIRAMLAELGPSAVENAAAVAVQAQALWPSVERIIVEAEHRYAGESDRETRFTSWPEEPWLRQALLQRQIRRLDPASRDVSARDLQRLAAAVDSIRRTRVSRELELVARRGQLVLRRVPQPRAEFELELDLNEPVLTPTGATVTVRPATHTETPKPRNPQTQRFQLPSGATPHFTLRNRRRGDRFHPLGMLQDKKLKDFLIDRKIAVEVRDSLPLLLFSSEIVWVAGVEVSERFKVTSPPGELYEVVIEHDANHGSDDGVQH